MGTPSSSCREREIFVKKLASVLPLASNVVHTITPGITRNDIQIQIDAKRNILGFKVLAAITRCEIVKSETGLEIKHEGV